MMLNDTQTEFLYKYLGFVRPRADRKIFKIHIVVFFRGADFGGAEPAKTAEAISDPESVAKLLRLVRAYH